MKRVSIAVVLVAIAACGGEEGQRRPPAARPEPVVAPAPKPAETDPLGPRPAVAPPAPFTPPVPVVYKRPNGMTVWLLERHALPLVSVDVVVPVGAKDDPKDKGGLAYQTANMLDEGAGARGALAIARDIDRLGATLATGATNDYSFVQLTTLKKNLAPAAAIMGDVLTRPTFSPVEWKRVSDLWKNDLQQRQSEPSAVANVVMLAKLFGPDHVYGHPTDGTTKSAQKVGLDDVKKFYEATWHPDDATCVVVGDVTKDEIDTVLDASFGKWAPAKQRAARGYTDVAPKAGRRVIVVDRPDAPQSVIALARRGVAASDPEAPPLTRVNAALGGSFTSRLNQDLREEHGWSYGARSRFSFTQLPGFFVAQAAVHTEHTGEALEAMIRDVEQLAKEGLGDEEVQKTRLLARAELVESFEGVEAAARRLARNAAVGLPADHEARAARAIDAAKKDDLARLAKAHVDPANAIVVIVGPRAQIQPQLEKRGITSLESSGPEGE
jgi:predicted Zn-dependent peptidase